MQKLEFLTTEDLEGPSAEEAAIAAAKLSPWLASLMERGEAEAVREVERWWRHGDPGDGPAVLKYKEKMDHLFEGLVALQKVKYRDNPRLAWGAASSILSNAEDALRARRSEVCG